MQVLSRVLSHAVDPLGKIAGNPCEGIKQLYRGDRSEIIWTAADIAELKTDAPPRSRTPWISPQHTGLRLGDLMRLSWSHVGEDAIVIATGKSKHRRRRSSRSTTICGPCWLYSQARHDHPNQQP